jgi:DNA-binding transcriptional ArsR family regulator
MGTIDRPVSVISRPSQAAAMLHPIRRRIMEALREPHSATTVARLLGLPRQKVNYHLRELEKEQLVELIEERKRGNCTERVLQARARSYVIGTETLGSLAADPEQIGNRFSSAYLTALAARAVDELGVLREQSEDTGERLSTFSMESEIRFRTPQTRTAFTQELTRVIGELIRKYDDGTARGRPQRLLVGSYPQPEPG